MTHRVNMLDIYHPAQHLVFVFSMAQNGSLRGLSVCATSPVLGMRKWTDVAQRTPCTLHAESAGDRVSLLPGIERALNSIVILLLCSSRERRHRFAHYDESIHSVRFFVLPRNPRHAWAIAVGRPCLSPACVDSRDLYPVELRASGKKKPNKKKQNNRVFSTGEEETESRRRSATAGSEITKSIVLRRVTRLLRNFLPATSRRRGVRSKRGGCGEGKKALLPAPLIFLSVCVCFTKECCCSHLTFITFVCGWSNQAQMCLYWSLSCHSSSYHFFFIPNYAQ